MRRSLLSFLFLVLLSFSGFSQNFEEVDAHVATVKPSDDLQVMVNELTAPFDSEMGKARAIFTWVATNVSYDCKEFHRQPKDRKARTKLEILERTAEKRTAICAGYAILFDEMCKLAELNAEIVSGYARISPRAPNPERMRNNHAWNAIEIDGKWHLLDATWAAGYSNQEVTKFTFLFDDRYFMAEPQQFFQRHWPENPKWQLLEKEQTAEDFSTLPHFYKLFPGMYLHAYSPELGVLNETEEGYRFRIHLEGAEQVYLRIGTRMIDMIENEENVFEYEIPRDRVRGRKLIIAAKKGDRIKAIMEYRLL